PDTIYYYELDNGTVFSRRFFYLPDDPNNLSYRIFMGGDYAKLDFTSSNKNGNTVVVLKDSFANALIPWLAPSYERIIVIDPRQFDGSVIKLLSDFDRADLVFVDYVAATTMSDFIEKFHDIK
ncbi:MAG: DHHW family protein, partial [Defluviitaleaceae bacterium]|nr:DHHW family protein [Defluviitaleaceae bacterium]